MTQIFFLAESPNIGVLFSSKIMFIRSLDDFLWDFENLTFFFSAPPSFLDYFPKHSKWLKIITRGRKDIPKPDFESSRRVLSKYDFVDAKFCIFDAFL